MFLAKCKGVWHQATRLSETQAHIQRSVKEPAKLVGWAELSDFRNWPFRLGQSYAGNRLLEIGEKHLIWDTFTTTHLGFPHVLPWTVGDVCYVAERKYTVIALSGDTAVIQSPRLTISHPVSILRRKVKDYEPKT